MITPQQIDIWLASPSEHQRLEFKEAKTRIHSGLSLVSYFRKQRSLGGLKL